MDTRGGGGGGEGAAAECELRRENIKETANNERREGCRGMVEKISGKQDQIETRRGAPADKIISNAMGTAMRGATAGTTLNGGCNAKCKPEEGSSA